MELIWARCVTIGTNTANTVRCVENPINCFSRNFISLELRLKLLNLFFREVCAKQLTADQQTEYRKMNAEHMKKSSAKARKAKAAINGA